jgi:S-adenosylmethionine-diacylgycerolhomoserine-N-methlytransferase
MPLLERLQNDFVVLRQLIRGVPRNVDHAQQLQAFYGPQAAQYDEFRDRLLPGRKELIQRLPLPENARVVELGGGTGRNLGFFGGRLDGVASMDLIDLCPALLDVARARTSDKSQVHIIEADATTYQPTSPVDCVYFSYSLTMIPNWQAALSNAWTMLKPGGVIGVVDFCMPARTASQTGVIKSFEAKFWKRWFAHDGVRLDPQHCAILRQLFPQNEIIERRAPVPYLPIVCVPYYLFIGRKQVIA